MQSCIPGVGTCDSDDLLKHKVYSILINYVKAQLGVQSNKIK